ncbi:MAG: hypothetical protein WAU11_15390 [Ignavibacteriaceae bacterium]
MSEQNKLSPEDYKKILTGIDLINISLKESKSFINTDVKNPIDIKIDINTESSFELKENNIVNITQHYKFDARKQNSKSRYVQIEVKFLVVLLSKETFSQEFFDIYKEISLRLNTWSYLREFINNMTSRMNVPSFTIPLFKA